MTKAPRYWIGYAPKVCDIRPEHKITTTFVDGLTAMGPWANMCPVCHEQFGRGLGLGLGQRYEKQADGRWLKTGG